MLALVFAVQTAAAAMCIGMPAAHAAEMSAEHCHTAMPMTAAAHADMTPHACSHCDAPDLGTPDVPAQAAMPTMALLAFVSLPQPETTLSDTAYMADPHAQAPPGPAPLYLTTQRIRI